MRLLLCAMVTLLVGQQVCAADASSLTAEEARAGWLLLFDGETTFGWQIKGEAKVEKGALVLGSKTEPTTAVLPGAFRDFELRFESEGKGRLTVDCGSGRVDPGWVDSKTIMHLEVVTGEGKRVHVVPKPSGTVGGVRTQGANISYDPNHRPVCRFEVPAGEQVKLTNVRLKPLNLPSIFNGKDLTGWKEHPGRKSKFSVTKEGWLNVKDGNGDLQTEGQWADFVLQLECISNGKHLNSGIFFRCKPNEYQQGYEAQIRNEFTAKPQKYLVEEYDPKTHELKGKKEVLSPAIDYGTGAIYRRQPARRGVAKDGEWFTLTVVAAGRHFATWVNGQQVADWTDNRKLNDNARNGCRLEKGPISIQGHDPTTDLSFRNIRIVELPARK